MSWLLKKMKKKYFFSPCVFTASLSSFFLLCFLVLLNVETNSEAIPRLSAISGDKREASFFFSSNTVHLHRSASPRVKFYCISWKPYGTDVPFFFSVLFSYGHFSRRKPNTKKKKKERYTALKTSPLSQPQVIYRKARSLRFLMAVKHLGSLKLP